jgi:hypothetical protein
VLDYAVYAEITLRSSLTSHPQVSAAAASKIDLWNDPFYRNLLGPHASFCPVQPKLRHFVRKSARKGALKRDAGFHSLAVTPWLTHAKNAQFANIFRE